ncbi:MAG: hypothetical protein OXB97_07830 [Rhodospirillales bacterium]|nr:hypothetical protein [Rhodospirillales bacterium]
MKHDGDHNRHLHIRLTIEDAAELDYLRRHLDQETVIPGRRHTASDAVRFALYGTTKRIRNGAPMAEVPAVPA